jgi:hypothetical protein
MARRLLDLYHRQLFRRRWLRDAIALPPDFRERAMARYFFHIHNGHDLPDESGTAFPGVTQAREEAIKTASELLRGDGHEFWNGPDWTMRVTDEVGLPVFTIRILKDDHSIRAER